MRSKINKLKHIHIIEFWDMDVDVRRHKEI